MLKTLSPAFGVALVLSSALSLPPAVQETKPANPLEQLLQAAFVAKNPKVTRAKVLELRSIGDRHCGATGPVASSGVADSAFNDAQDLDDLSPRRVGRSLVVKYSHLLDVLR